MTEVRIFKPPNRLAKTLHGLGTVPVAQLAADAENRVAEMGETLRTYVRARVKEILAYKDLDEAALTASSAPIGKAALEVAEVAGPAGMGAIGEVAGGINAMVENVRTTGKLHAKAFKLHIDSLVLLSEGSGARTPETDIILARLAAMRIAVGVVD